MKYVASAFVLLILIGFWIKRQNVSRGDVVKCVIQELKVALGFIFVGVAIYFLLPILLKGSAGLNLFGFFKNYLILSYLPYLLVRYVLFVARAEHGITGGKLTPKGNIVLSGDWL